MGCTVGFIGVGAMGEPMCRNLIRAGSGAGIEAVLVYDLTPDPLARLAADGAEIAANLPDLAARCDVTILSLPGGPEVEAVCETALIPGARLGSAARPGWTVIDMSTTPVRLTRTLAARFAEVGGRFLDAPVARTRQAAIDGALSIMVGGAADVLAEMRPILATMGTDISHCGPVGCGQITKILNNMLLFQHGVALAEALVIAEQSGMDPGALLTIVNKGSGASFAGQNHGVRAMVPGEFPQKQFPARYALKDLHYALTLAADGGVPTPGAEVAEQMLEAAIAMGHGEEYWPTIIKAVRARVQPEGPD